MTTETYSPDISSPEQPGATEPLAAPKGIGARYGAFIVRYRWVVVAIWIIVLAASVPFSAQVTNNLSSGGFTWDGSESLKAGDIISKNFTPALPQVNVVFHSDTATPDDLSYTVRVQQFIAAAKDFPHVAKVTPGGVGQDGKTTFVTVEFNQSGEATEAAMADFQKLLPTDGPAQAYITGDPETYHQITEITSKDIAQSEEFTLPIAGLALLIIFGTLVATAIPLGLAIITIPITLALIYGISIHTEMSIYVTSIATIIGLGLSIDYSLFQVRRFRDELSLGRTVNDAVRVTMATSGEAILFSGLTVLIGFIGLSLVGIPFMTSMAIGGAVVVAASVLGALTLVPAILSILGTRVFATRLPLPWRNRRQSRAATEVTGFWHHWAMAVMQRPVLVVTGVLVVLAVLIYPFFSLTTGLPGVSSLPPTSDARIGNDLLKAQFPSEQTSPVVIVFQTRDGSSMLQANNLTALCQLTRTIAQVPNTNQLGGIVADTTTPCEQQAQLFASGAYEQSPQLVSLVKATTSGDTSLVSISPQGQLDSESSKAVVKHIRAISNTTPLAMYVGGAQAVSLDLGDYLYGNFPKTLVFIFVATYIVLLIMFRSVLLPIKAVIMNLLSVGAAYGALVWVFQWGNLSQQLQFSSEGFIEMTTPILLFCILFGLSMDYEVFLLSRVREEWDRTGDNRYAVARGLEKTAGVITSAALIIVIVGSAFVLTRLTLTKELGMGMAVAVFVDATIIRILLVPATMRLLGRYNWWFPGQKPKQVATTATSEE